MVPSLLGGQNSCQPVAIQCRSINWHSCGLAQLKPIGSQSEANYVSNHRTSPLYGCKEVSQRRMIWTKPVVPYLTIQSRANRKWRVVQQVDYMDSTKCLLGARSLRKCPSKSNANSKLIYSHSFTIPIRINPLFQRPASIKH